MRLRTDPAEHSPTALAFILVVSLFFLWGFSYGLLDVLNKHFQDVLHVGKRQSSLLQAAYFGAYFLMALPAGWIIRRSGYRSGVLVGLVLFAAGACMFYPAQDFTASLAALFVLACGLTFLETAANPFMTVLGPPQTAAFRLNLAQGFNGVGSVMGPLIGGWFFFGNGNMTGGMDQVRGVYLAIAVVVLLIAFVFTRIRLPETLEETTASAEEWSLPYYRQPVFRYAVIAQFFYVAAQVGIAAFFINYCTSDEIGISKASAAYCLSVAMVLFTAGRFIGSFAMKRWAAGKLLLICALVNVFLCAWIAAVPHPVSVLLLVAVFFFESIMFPTIFAIGIRGLGHQTKNASSVLVMSIVGGAIVPYAMGALAEMKSVAFAFVIPVLCFLVVAGFAKASINKY